MSAVISDCGNYRYRLGRPAGSMFCDDPPALFLMLNPSTADAELDDNTIRRCRDFAERWGCAGLSVANLYAYRATDPSELWQVEDPVGPDNDDHLEAMVREHGTVVCAWGTNARPDRVQAVLDICQRAGANLWCLGTTKDGSPRHPLYIRKDQPLIPWPPG